MDVNEININDFFLTQYVHVTANTLPPSVLTEAFIDDFGYTQIGIDMYDPSISESLKLNPVTHKYEISDIANNDEHP